MKVKFLGETDPFALINGKVYDVISIEEGWYRIIDEEGFDETQEIQGYLYPPELFEIVEDDDNS